MHHLANDRCVPFAATYESLFSVRFTVDVHSEGFIALMLAETV